MKIHTFKILLMVLACFYHISYSTAQPKAESVATYAFVAGLSEDGRIETYDMTGDGTISLRSTFNLWDHRIQFIDPWDVCFSPKGDYAFFVDWDAARGAIYSVDKDLRFHFIREENGGCTGLSFTRDGQYCFSTTNFLDFMPPKINIYKVNGGSFDIVKSQDVPATATLSWLSFCTTGDEIIASTLNGYLNSFFGLVVYQFDRVSEKLTLKQYLKTPETSIMYADSAKDCSVIVHSQGHGAGSIVRQLDGSYKEVAWVQHPPEWHMAYSPNGTRITSNGQYAVTVLPNTFRDDVAKGNGGVVLYSVKPNGEMAYLSIAPRYGATSINMTPDSKFFVIGYDFGRTLGVFQINKEKGILEEISTFNHTALGTPAVFFMRSFPQIHSATPVEEKNWSLYGDSAHSLQKIADKVKTEKNR